MLLRLFEGLRRATEPRLVGVATSSDEADDPIAHFCASKAVPCHRGSLEDVAARFLGAAERWELDRIVRISGDSPLLDHRLVDHALRLDSDHEFEVVTNVSPRTFPQGQSIEVVDASTLAEAYPRMTPEDREHVTTILYREGKAKVLNFGREPAADHLRMVVDTEPDAARIEGVLARMTRPHWEYTVDDLIELWKDLSDE